MTVPETSAETMEKAIVMWLNSTMGLLILLLCREETRGAWIDFKKPTLLAMPVLDIKRIERSQLEVLSDAFEELSEKQLQPFPMMGTDAVRQKMDHAVAHALGLTERSLDTVRSLLGREPVVTLERL